MIREKTIYLTSDGKSFECREYAVKQVESLVGEGLQAILESAGVEHSIEFKRMIMKMSDIETARKMQRLLNLVLNYGN